MNIPDNISNLIASCDIDNFKLAIILTKSIYPEILAVVCADIITASKGVIKTSQLVELFPEIPECIIVMDANISNIYPAFVDNIQLIKSWIADKHNYFGFRISRNVYVIDNIISWLANLASSQNKISEIKSINSVIEFTPDTLIQVFTNIEQTIEFSENNWLDYIICDAKLKGPYANIYTKKETNYSDWIYCCQSYCDFINNTLNDTTTVNISYYVAVKIIERFSVKFSKAKLKRVIALTIHYLTPTEICEQLKYSVLSRENVKYCIEYIEAMFNTKTKKSSYNRTFIHVTKATKNRRLQKLNKKATKLI